MKARWSLPLAPLLALLLATGAAQALSPPEPPVAPKKAHVVKSPAGDREDPYYWLRDDKRENPELLSWLRKEIAYKDAALAHTKASEQVLYDEIIGRLKQDDSSVPAQKNGYWYYVRYEEGKEYPIHARRRTKKGPEEILLDGNAMAAGLGFFQIGNYEVTHDNKLMAYATDTVGRRQWVVNFKNLETGEVLADTLKNVDASLAWANDGRTLLYIEKNPQTLLGYKIRKHVVGTDPANDPVVYEEKDRSFYLGLAKSRSDRYIYLYAESTVSSEQQFADANDPALAFKTIVPRERDHEYQAEDLDDRFIIRTNHGAKNFRIVEAPIADAGDRAKWKDVIGARDDAFVNSFIAQKDHLVVEERSGGLRKLHIKKWNDGREWMVEADEPAYTTSIDDNPEQDNEVLRYAYTSLTTPRTIYDLNLRTGAKREMKRDPVLGDFDPARYTTEFLHATARDGTKIPVSIVYRNEFGKGKAKGLYQYGYGSYGISMDPSFVSQRLSLLDRGVAFAIAHVRGGQEMGRAWYDSGKLLAKKNTFTDFIDVTEFLVREGYAPKGKVVAAGGSAGGLLIGAVANMRPDLYHALAAHVPFVDVVTTMLDETIPLTTNEFDEWGNPKNKPYYDYMLSYSPYDNVRAQDYPSMLVTTGLWDSQVQYFEPAKWVARLRELKTDDNPLVFHVNMEAGHGGKSGRFQRYREIAMEYAFFLDQLGVRVAPAKAVSP